MGNYLSCTLLSSAVSGRQLSSRGSRVVFPTGEIRHFYEPVKAAELMLETPNFFLVNTKSLHIGRRFSALNADEDLEMSNAYVMFPMKRLNSVVTAADMGALFLTANSVAAAKRPASLGLLRVKVLPENCSNNSNTRSEQSSADRKRVSVPKLNLDDIEEYASPEFQHRLSMSRSKKPLLETIAEEPFCLR